MYFPLTLVLFLGFFFDIYIVDVSGTSILNF
jgi:hypothetical protein